MTEATAQDTSRAREKQIAEGFMTGFPWPMLIWPLVNTTVWLALWPLVLSGALPLWAGFAMALLNMTASYLPSHDAQHHIFFARGSRFHWLNELIGYYSLIPLASSLCTLRETHLEHHRHANDPIRDPDYYITEASDVRAALWHGLTKNQPRNDRYGPTLARLGTPIAKRAIFEALVSKAAFFGILSALAWAGHAAEAVLLWWLPRHIAMVYINFYLSWLPHFPGTEQGRYRDTRAFISKLGNLGSSGMQYHIVHHLYPSIALHRTPAAYRALRPILEERGCDLGGL